MKSLLTIILSALLLTACATATSPPPVLGAPVVTAPIRASNIDERGLKIAYESADALLYAVDGLVAAKVVKPGTPAALKIGASLTLLQRGLTAAAAAQRAGNAESYLDAMQQASAAIAQIKTIIQEIRR